MPTGNHIRILAVVISHQFSYGVAAAPYTTFCYVQNPILGNLSKYGTEAIYRRFSFVTHSKSVARMASTPNDEVLKAVQAAATAASANTGNEAPPTIFDKIIAGEIPCNKVYEDELALAFRDVNPQAPVHCLIIPKKRDGLTQLCKANESQKDILGHLLYVASQVGKQECPNGYRLVINDGADAAQSVYHLHIHVLGGRQMGWPPG